MREPIWPIVSGTDDFLVDYLYLHPDGYYTSLMSWSSEHGKMSAGATCDHAIAREILQCALELAEVLEIDGEREEVETGARVGAVGRAEQQGVPVLHGHSTTGQAGQLARLDGERATAELGRKGGYRHLSSNGTTDGPGRVGYGDEDLRCERSSMRAW